MITVLGPLNEAVVSCRCGCVCGAAWLLGLSSGFFGEDFCLRGTAYLLRLGSVYFGEDCAVGYSGAFFEGVYSYDCKEVTCCRLYVAFDEIDDNDEAIQLCESQL